MSTIGGEKDDLSGVDDGHHKEKSELVCILINYLSGNCWKETTVSDTFAWRHAGR